MNRTSDITERLLRAANFIDEASGPDLVACLYDAEEEIERLCTLVHVPGMWRCAKCGFFLIQSNLNAQDGTITARDEPGTKCPNCNVPLWRITWKEHAEEMERRCEQAVIEGANLRSRSEKGEK